MGKTILIRLDEFDLGQLLDGLSVRAECWRNTQRYLETGIAPRIDFIAEECLDADEAQKIADHYDQIIAKIAAQRRAQSDCEP